MIILLEENEYTKVTLASITSNCSSDITTIVTDNIDQFVEDNIEVTEPIFSMKGKSLKIVTKRLEAFLKTEINNLKYYSVGKQYPGAYFKKSFGQAYELSNLGNYITCFDKDVMLINPAQYRIHKDDDLLTCKARGDVTLLPYNLNAKDDFLMTQIIDPYPMLKKNVWFHTQAAMINFSLDIINVDDIDSCVLMPFDLLDTFTRDSGIDIAQQISYKALVSSNLFGKIKGAMIA